MSNNKLNEEIIKGHIKELVRGSVEETLNKLLEAEAEKLTRAARYERSEVWRNYPLRGEYSYVYVDGIYLKRNWGAASTKTYLFW